jgi:hypothetical protein
MAAGSGGGRHGFLDSGELAARPGQQARSGALLGPRDDACGDWAAGKEDGQEFDAASHGGVAALVSAHCAQPANFTHK